MITDYPLAHHAVELLMLLLAFIFIAVGIGILLEQRAPDPLADSFDKNAKEHT